MLANKEGRSRTCYVKDYVIFDLETTGISSKLDAVIEISAVKVKGGKVIDEFSSLVNPKRPIPYAASSVNGIYDDMVADKPDFRQVLGDFLSFIGDLPLVGHNINSFDMKFIYRDSMKFFGKVPDNDYIDTLKMAKALYPDMKHRRLVDMAELYGFSSEGAHRALNDCRMNQKVYEAMGAVLNSTGCDKPKKKENEGGFSWSGSRASNPGIVKKDIGELLGLSPVAGGKAGTVNDKICPKCGNILQERKGKFGAFIGCTGYPNCRYTRNL